MNELISLRGRVAVISGGASGIGLGTARVLGAHGASLVILDIDEPAGKKALSELSAQGFDALFLRCDVTKEAEVKAAVGAAVGRYGKIDILFNNAGVMVRRKVTELTVEEWDRVLDAGLKGTFLLSKHVIPVMERNGGGSIINTGSGWGLKGGDSAAAYCAVKGGIVNLTRAMAIDHGPRNIRVNSVNPGDTDTNMLRDEARQLGRQDIEGFLKASAERRPLKRLGMPEDIGRAVLFLASDLSAWVTGASLVVDGGSIA